MKQSLDDYLVRLGAMPPDKVDEAFDRLPRQANDNEEEASDWS